MLRLALTALVLAAALAGPAHADEKTIEDYLQLLTPELRTRIERARTEFEHWPDPRGKAAAEQVLDCGEAAIPFLAVDLQEGSAKVRACAAHVAGRMGAKVLFRHVVEASRNDQCRPYLGDFFRAMVKLDADASVEPLIQWLWEKDTGVRHTAYRFLDAMASPKMVSQLSAVLGSSTSHSGSREYAIKLLSAIDHPSVYDPLVAHLSDSSPDVAREASDGLARFRDPVLVEKLRTGFGDARDRTAGFSLRTLVMIEDRHGIQVLKPEDATKLLAWTQQADLRFLRAMGTIGLVNLGFAVEDPRVVEFLDRWAVPFLVDTVGGGVFFDEYRSVRDLCFAKLHQITGAALGFKVNDWKTWWVANRATFKAVRGLRKAADVQPRRMEVRYELAEPGQEPRSLHFSVGTRWGLTEPAEGVEPIVLSAEEMAEVLARLEEVSFFDLERVFGVERERARRLELHVRVENLVRRVVVHGYDARRLEGVLTLLEGMAENHRWQRFWDKRTFPEWQRWYEAYEPFWRQNRDPLERNRKMKSMIIMSYEFLPPRQREEAGAELLALMEQDADLSENGLSILTAYLKAESGLTRSAVNLIKVLAESRQMAAIRVAISFLLERGSSTDAPALLNHVLEKGGGAVCAYMLRESDARLRAAACEVMWKFEDEQVDGLLAEATKDTSLAVRRSAAYGLGLRGKPVAVGVLADLVENGEDLELRRASVVALGRILGRMDRDADLSPLMGALASPDLKASALRGLGLTRNPDAVTQIFAILERESGDPIMLKVAIDALLEIGGPEVVDRFTKLAGTADRADLRLAAYRALAILPHENRAEFLAGGLEDPDPGIQLEVALQLGRLGDASGLPILVQALSRGERTLACESELQRLTYRAAAGADLAEKAAFYAEWWQDNHGVGRRVWFLNALRTKGYPVETLVDWASGDSKSRAGCALLVAVLYDDQWFLAAGASEALREISGRTDLPVIDQNTAPSGRAEVHLKWKAWWKTYQEISGGK